MTRRPVRATPKRPRKAREPKRKALKPTVPDSYRYLGRFEVGFVP